jgi:2-oxoglutarate dehydrogenase E1 component
VLRLQASARPRRPLIVFTPKSMLRRKEAVSQVEDFTHGTFQPVIPDQSVAPADTTRVLLCSGKLYWDLLAARAKAGDTTTQIVRFEQLYPLDEEQIRALADSWPATATCTWVQDEPANQGAWSFMMRKLTPLLGGRGLDVISRPEAASPATGSHAAHAAEQRQLLAEAFGTPASGA